MPWKTHKRRDPRRSPAREFASLRPAGIAFSSEFIRNNSLRERARVSILVDGEKRRLGFVFHDDEKQEDAYALSSDGSKSQGMWLQTTSLYDEYAWLKNYFETPAFPKRLPIKKDSKGVFFVEISPAPVE
jgi:hypothetical protein